MKELLKRALPVLDVVLLLVVYPAAGMMWAVRKAGVHRLPLCKKALLQIGVFPIRRHYYEPQFDFRTPEQPFSEDRELPGIHWNVAGQLAMLERLTFAEELSALPTAPSDRREFYLGNKTFKSGDAEYWYQLIRALKPARIFEIGSGNSTLMARRALAKNEAEDPDYHCEHVCVEPYEMDWLEGIGVSVIRQRIEQLDLSLFSQLQPNDILFIDSSHMIRPQGDVVVEYLQVLPALKPGVFVHVHDIFSPKNYLTAWLQDEVKFWNEQYLLEAFLSENANWEIVGALNFLHHHHYAELKNVAPHLTPDREPGSFYMRKIG